MKNDWAGWDYALKEGGGMTGQMGVSIIQFTVLINVVILKPV